ncbi:TonB family protein [Amaricoccus macauensis]|uniref:energy transducer TonB n=1 Tax=Amaricoccus macauensis TaxID=57001 RepID=UPI003C7E5FD3
MIPSSARMKLLALIGAFAVHGALTHALTPEEDTLIEGQAGAAEARLGTSFADMVAGTLSSTPAEDLLEPPDPEAVQDMPREKTRETERAKPSPPETAQPAEQPKPIEPAIEAPALAESVAPFQTAAASMAEPARSVAAQAPEPPKPVEAKEPEPEEAEAEDVTESEQAEAETPPDPMPRPEDLPRREAKPAPQGNAQRTAAAGQAKGTTTATAVSSGSGGKSQEAGNAAATNYPGEVFGKISRMRRPRGSIESPATVHFVVAPNGGLVRVAVARSSGSVRFDNAVIAMVKRAAPFPPPPPGARRDFSFKLGTE